MNTTLVFCALAMTGWASQDVSQPISPVGQNAPEPIVQNPAQSANQNSPNRNLSSQPVPRYAAHASRAASEGNRSRARMPLSPTDPRTFSDASLPLPPTAESTEEMPSQRIVDTRLHFVSSNSGDSGRRSSGDKPFDRYSIPSPTSPYQLLYNNTDNGTISTYNSYVRPALADQASRAADENWSDQPAPTYPPVFLNQGQYYPNDLGGR